MDPEAQLPQTFPHGLHPSSLEPGATDQQHPLSILIPEPPRVGEENHEHETPLQQVTHLRQTMTKLVADLSSSLWAKATDQERYITKGTVKEQPEPKIALLDRVKSNYTLAFLYTGDGALNINGHVPKETIIDTEASKVMISKKFAVAIRLDLNNLKQGTEFTTASGAIEQPLGVTQNKIIFTSSRGTRTECKAEIQATTINTLAYDAL